MAYAGGGHDLPPSSLGDRKAFLNIAADPEIASVSERIGLSYTFLDEATGKAIPHVTYVVGINDSMANSVFSEVVHGHDGKVDLQFRPSDAKPYRVNANFDNLAASYVSDFGSPIIIDGAVLSEPGSYKAIIEVTGVDFDNTFLPEPIKYEFNFSVLQKQPSQVHYEDMAFDLNILSPVQISSTEFRQENKQLIIRYPGSEAIHLDDFRVAVDIPKEMMAGPFTASFGNIGQLDIQEELLGDNTVRLIMKSTHLDVMQQEDMAHDGMEEMENTSESDMSNSIVITATTMVPEFPFGLPVVAAASFAAALVLFRGAGQRFFKIK